MPDRDRVPVSRATPPGARAPGADKPGVPLASSAAGNQELLHALGVHEKSGEAVAPSVRQEYERCFRADLTGVRIHTDSAAQTDTFSVWHIYEGQDDPGGAAALAGQWRFLLKVVDVCNGGTTVGTQDVIRINW